MMSSESRSVLLSLPCLLTALLGCSASFTAAPSSDAGPGRGDASAAATGMGDADAEEPPTATACDPHEFRGCALATYQWFWDGVRCALLEECVGLGAPSRRACREAHRVCTYEDPCEAMDAYSPAPCLSAERRVMWDGTACRDLTCASACAGEDCPGAFESMEACRAEYQTCGARAPSCGARPAIGPQQLCLREPGVSSDRAQTLRVRTDCAQSLTCDVVVEGDEIAVSICGETSDACPDHRSEVQCEIPPLGRTGTFQLVINGRAPLEVTAYDSEADAEPGCFCGAARGSTFEADETDDAHCRG